MTTGRPIRLAAPLALAALSIVLSGCGRFGFNLEAGLLLQGTGETVSDIFLDDEAEAAGSVWKQRHHISSVDIRSATATVDTAGITATTDTWSGSVWLLPEGATSERAEGAALVGSWSGESLMPGTVIVLDVTPEAEALLRATLKGSGKVGIYATGHRAGGFSAPPGIRVQLDVEVKWQLW